MAHSTVTLSDGAKIQVWLLGDNTKSKPLAIALHGGPGLSSHFEPENSFSFLTSRFRVLVYDARGSGESDAKGPLTDERWVADVDEIR
jgi:proline iminopeptidase